MRECVVVLDLSDPQRSLYQDLKPWLNSQGYRFIRDYSYSFVGRDLVVRFKSATEELLTLLILMWGAREIFK